MQGQCVFTDISIHFGNSENFTFGKINKKHISNKHWLMFLRTFRDVTFYFYHI